MNAQPSIAAPLDPGFQPAVLWDRTYVAAARASGQAVPFGLALERENGLVSRFESVVTATVDAAACRYAERVLKFLLWAKGGWRIHVAGPHALGEHLQRCYAPGGERAFDADLMGRIYERPVEVVLAGTAADLPPAREQSAALGGHLDGCRIGFDLGASDYKVAAVREGEAVYSDEFPWDPKNQPDPQYHFDKLQAGLRQAAAHLPRVDAIGGSTAGVVVNNRMMVASLFRSVPPAKFDGARAIFQRVQEAWRVPVAVANDGDVTALAGAMSLGATAVLGVAMGSSEAAGYLAPDGGMTGWLSELAFAPVDYSPQAAADEWSGDRGVGAQYFSQQAVNKLLPAAGIAVPPDLGLPERLKEVQCLMAQGDPRAAKIYETIGVYLGYAIPHYAAFYDYRHLLILGRVTTGPGGEVILARARSVLAREFPEVAAQIQVHVPDEKSRRVGQAVAAASLPKVK